MCVYVCVYVCVCLSLSFRLSLSEQNADRKCSCRNDSLRRRQTLTTTPSSLLHFRRRHRRRRHSGSQLCLSAPAPAGSGGAAAAATAAEAAGAAAAVLLRALVLCNGRPWMLPVGSLLQDGVYAVARVTGLIFFFFFSFWSPSRRQQPGAGPLWWREAGISLFSGAPGLIAPHPQSRRRRPAEAALLSLTGRPRAPGGSRAPAAGGLDADLSNAVPAAVMDGSSRERPDPMSVWVIFCEEHSPRR